ncbi:4512_t:CDS:2 [Acaulospora colombiana]|uniref:4512_t:CDS:1 n=1 Tax=Acaulospora colombiana TaxID=27376 RepID=A0ACA9NZR2_9GLOM|nr:4512_t:CDS:2 [Acaulospora colombiana]
MTLTLGLDDHKRVALTWISHPHDWLSTPTSSTTSSPRNEPSCRKLHGLSFEEILSSGAFMNAPAAFLVENQVKIRS